MDVNTLKDQIMNNNLSKWYIFCGDEYKAQQIYIDKIAEVKHLNKSYIDSVSEVYSNTGKSLFSNNYLYICRDDKAFLKADNAWSSIDEVLGNNMLIFIVTEIDKRGKLYKQSQDNMIVFEKFSRPTLVRYIQSKLKLSNKSCELLIDICEYDYGRILIELDKIYHYGQGLPEDKHLYDNALNQLIEDGTIYVPPTDAIFEFTKAVLKHKIRLAYDLLDECIRLGEPNLRLITVLYTNFKHLLQVKSCTSDDISKSTGLQPWEIRNVKDCIDIYSIGDIVYFLRLLENAEKGIKTGRIDEDVALEYCLVNIFC